MADANVVYVDNKHGPSVPFWLVGVTRLSVVFVFEGPEEDAAGDRACVAVGLDRDLHRVVFWAHLRRSQQAAFVQAVRDGRTGTHVSDGSTSAIGKRRPGARNENTAPGGRALARDGLDDGSDEDVDVNVVVIPTGGGGGDGPGPKSFLVPLVAPSAGGAGAKAVAGGGRRETASPTGRKRARPSRRK